MGTLLTSVEDLLDPADRLGRIVHQTPGEVGVRVAPTLEEFRHGLQPRGVARGQPRRDIHQAENLVHLPSPDPELMREQQTNVGQVGWGQRDLEADRWS